MTQKNITLTEHIQLTLNVLASQLMFTFGCILSLIFFPTIKIFFSSNLYDLLLIGLIGSICNIYYMCNSEKMTECQLIMLTIFQTISTCCITVRANDNVIFMAIITTFGLSLSLATYSIFTNFDHGGLLKYISSGLTLLISMAVMGLFFQIQFFELFKLYFGLLVFFGYIIFDVQFFIKEKIKNPSSIADDLYIEAAMNIYLDVLNIFIRMLSILQQSNKKNKKTK